MSVLVVPEGFGDNRFCQLPQLECDEAIKFYSPASKGNGKRCLAQLACGLTSSFAVTSEGEMFAWGAGLYSETLRGDERNSMPKLVFPHLVRGLSVPLKIMSLSCGQHLVLAAVMGCEGAISWGGGDIFMLGHQPCGSCCSCDVNYYPDGGAQAGSNDHSHSIFSAISPAWVQGLRKLQVISVAVGERHCVAVTKDPCRVYVWGSSNLGLGRPDGRPSCTPLPLALPHEAPDPIVAKCGANHSCIITAGGKLMTFGSGMHGELGHGLIQEVGEPAIVESLLGVGGMLPSGEFQGIVCIDCGDWHTVALSSTGDVYSWGWNVHGALGFKTELGSVLAEPQLVPDAEVDEGDSIVSVGCGSRYTLALSREGRVLGWGNVSSGLSLGSKPSIVKERVHMIGAGPHHFVLA
jgi:alpha-tubulin suppressor-like RCC1 family protein